MGKRDGFEGERIDERVRNGDKTKWAAEGGRGNSFANKDTERREKRVGRSKGRTAGQQFKLAVVLVKRRALKRQATSCMHP